MKVLQLYYKFPFPIYDGGAYSVYSATESILTAGIEVKILAMRMLKEPGDVHKLPSDFKENTDFEFVEVDNRLSIKGALASLLKGTSYFAIRFESEDFRRKLTEILLNESFDVIQLEHLYLCSYIGLIRQFSDARIVLRAQNIEHLVWKQYYKRLRNPLLKLYFYIEARKLRKYENAMLKLPDGIIALTDNDVEYFRRYSSQKAVVSIPIGILSQRSAKYSNATDSTPGNLIYHLGSMDWRPNVEGMKWFIRKVLPILIKGNSEIKIYIAGKKMGSWFFRRESKNLIVQGTVSDAGEYIADKSIMIVPLLSGSGIRVKILEGLKEGKVVVSTSIGAMGIECKEPKSECCCEYGSESILIADNADDFAKKILRVYNSPDLCQHISDNARNLAHERFDIKEVGMKMADYYHKLILKTKEQECQSF